MACSRRPSAASRFRSCCSMRSKRPIPTCSTCCLQVTGEGRLTDALGRTADFSNCVVVMTSNLGTTAGTGQIGLAPAELTRQHTYVKAAENFFRPEFFNRLDRVIPFETLSRDQMRRIAELLLADVFQRDGLVRRRCAPVGRSRKRWSGSSMLAITRSSARGPSSGRSSGNWCSRSPPAWRASSRSCRR